jgi:hypothetical protein
MRMSVNNLMRHKHNVCLYWNKISRVCSVITNVIRGKYIRNSMRATATPTKKIIRKFNESWFTSIH